MVFFGVGVVTGTVGINYSHELMHQTPRIERWMADILLAMVLWLLRRAAQKSAATHTDGKDLEARGASWTELDALDLT